MPVFRQPDSPSHVAPRGTGAFSPQAQWKGPFNLPGYGRECSNVGVDFAQLDTDCWNSCLSSDCMGAEVTRLPYPNCQFECSCNTCYSRVDVPEEPKDEGVWGP